MRRNRPSSSALRVAHAVAFLSREPEVAALLPPGLGESTERLLLASGLLRRAQLRRLDSPFFRRLYYYVDSLGANGQLLFVGMRKRLVADEAAAAIASGCRQVLVIGGGLDILALRLAQQHAELTLVEVDHPASQHRKRDALRQLGQLEQLGPLPPNLHLVPEDLAAGDLADALRSTPAWEATRPTFAVAEAVFMYLDLPAVERTLRELHDATGPGSSVLFSYLRRDAKGRLLLGKRPRLAALALAAGGEPLRWAAQEGELEGFLAAAGWRLEVERFDLRERYLSGDGLAHRPLADVELYALARRA
ncbi:MAG TPA: SAM-dependent methyltransferase [Thermoanaerobaculia bacterium]|nr:SAM-dependent methyltransferase [Thermoanaerobaculia bacterium]